MRENHPSSSSFKPSTLRLFCLIYPLIGFMLVTSNKQLLELTTMTRETETTTATPTKEKTASLIKPQNNNSSREYNFSVTNFTAHVQGLFDLIDLNETYNKQLLDLTTENDTYARGKTSFIAKQRNNHSSRENDFREYNFPVTNFTAHVQGLLDLIDLNEVHKCARAYHLHVESPYTIPRVDCPQVKVKWLWGWCRVLQNMFVRQNKHPQKRPRVLPNNVTIGISTGDWMSGEEDGYGCLGSSAPLGEFTITNFLEIKRMARNKSYPILPWSNRSSVPVWRGTAWVNDPIALEIERNVIEETKRIEMAMSASPRMRAVAWSKEHSTLLDASIGRDGGFLEDDAWRHNRTNGLYKLLPIHSIPEEEYYTGYQVAVVLCGIGASFRTSIHLSTSTAIVLQQCPYEEWFTPRMVPLQHYIPLAGDLGNLSDVMHWIKDTPKQVQTIAERGHQFYLDYLSFEQNEEHIYELLYRLSLKNSTHPRHLTSLGT